MNEALFINGSEIIVNQKNQDLTKSVQTVKRDFAKYWEKEHINRCIDAVNNPSHQMLLRFLWMSGVRISEATTMRKQDIDFTNYTITVKWLKNRKYHRRVVPIHPTLRSMLQVFTANIKADEIVFPLTRQRAWQLTQKHLGGHPHQLRHSFAVNWLRCDGDLVMLHKVLGHSKIQTTMEYLNIVPSDQAKELMRITFI